MCHDRTPAIMSIRKAKSEMRAAVPKSSTMINATTRPTTAQMGTNRFQNNLISSLNLSQIAARKKMTAHFASSDG